MLLRKNHRHPGMDLRDELIRLVRDDRASKGTRQIRVILYAKGDLHGARAPADELPIEDILARRRQNDSCATGPATVRSVSFLLVGVRVRRCGCGWTDVRQVPKCYLR
jgi:hypothetical protein